MKRVPKKLSRHNAGFRSTRKTTYSSLSIQDSIQMDALMFFGIPIFCVLCIILVLLFYKCKEQMAESRFGGTSGGSCGGSSSESSGGSAVTVEAPKDDLPPKYEDIFSWVNCDKMPDRFWRRGNCEGRIAELLWLLLKALSQIVHNEPMVPKEKSGKKTLIPNGGTNQVVPMKYGTGRKGKNTSWPWNLSFLFQNKRTCTHSYNLYCVSAFSLDKNWTELNWRRAA